MKARKFLAFVAAAGMLFAGVGCTPDEPIDDLEKATLSVIPTEKAFALVGGEVTLELTSNCDWNIEADAPDVEILPTSGNGNASVTVTVPESTVARNIVLNLTAQRVGSVAGRPYPTDAKATVVLFQNEKGEAKFTTNVKAVRAALKKSNIPSASNADEAAAVSADVAAMTLTAVVVGEADGNMSLNQLMAVQDDSTEPESGLMLYCDNAKSMDKGQVVKVSLATAKVADYNGIIQLYTDDAVAIGAPIEVTPIEATLANMRNYESQYIKISNLHPDPSAVGKEFSKAASNKSIAFFDANYDQITIRLSNYASFKDDVIPAKEGAVCGISSYYSGTKELQLIPQYFSDFELTTDFVFDAQTVTIDHITKPGLYKVENAWVVGFTGNGVILTDTSGAFINTYINSNSHKTLGEKMTIEGVANNHQGGYQFDSPKITKVEGTVEVTYPEPENYTEASAVEELVANYGSENAPYLAKYVELSGIVNVSGGYYNLIIADVDQNAIKGSLSKTPDEALKLDDFNGKAVKLRGFVTDYNTPYLSIVATSVEIDSSLVSISVENVAIVAAAGIENGVSAISSNGLKNEDITVTPDGTVVTAAKVDVETQTLTYTISANTGVAREGTVTLSVSGMNDVVITFSQLGSDTTVSTIAEVRAGTQGTEYTVVNALVVANSADGIVITDSSNENIYVFKPSVTPNIGEIINIKGKLGNYKDAVQITDSAITKTGKTQSTAEIVPTAYTASEFDTWCLAANTAKKIEYVKVTAILNVGSTCFVNVLGSSSTARLLKTTAAQSEELAAFDDKLVDITLYLLYTVPGSNGGVDYNYLAYTSVVENTTTPVLEVENIDDVKAAGVTDATATISAINISSVSATCDGTIVTAAEVNGNTLTYTVAKNTVTEQREGWIKLSATGVDEVTIKVTQQAALPDGVEVATITFSEYGYNNADEMISQEYAGITLTFDQGTHSTSAPKYYDTGTGARLYAGNTMKIEKAGADIIGIVFKYSGASYTTNGTVDSGTITADGATEIWTGTASSVTLTSGRICRMQSMEVQYKVK